MKHICKITNYTTEQSTHMKDHFNSKTYKLAYEKKLLELGKKNKKELNQI